MKTVLSIASLVIGVVGLGVFARPVIEIICGVGGLTLAYFAKDPEAGAVIRGVRSWGNSLAWVNILWVCLEFALKIAGIDLLEKLTNLL